MGGGYLKEHFYCFSTARNALLLHKQRLEMHGHQFFHALESFMPSGEANNWPEALPLVTPTAFCCSKPPTYRKAPTSSDGPTPKNVSTPPTEPIQALDVGIEAWFATLFPGGMAGEIMRNAQAGY